jgi:F-type H+-transporting ATPase subunit a
MELQKSIVYTINSLVVMVFLLLVFGLAARKPKKIPGRLQMFAEICLDGLRGLFKDALGEGGERHMPLALTLFLFMFIGNIIGQLPLGTSPTANPSTTVGLGVMVFLYVQYIGIRANGVWGYLKHFAGPILFLIPLMFVIEVIGELTKPFSLGMRLFGNIYAEDIINNMAAQGGGHYWVPAQFPVYFLQLFTDTVQALIFALLTCAYISLMSPAHHEEGDDFDHKPHKETNEEHFIGSMAAAPGADAHIPPSTTAS